jgi:uncharacterized protein
MSHLCDTNIWLALALEHHTDHADARRWLDSVDAVDSVGFCRATQLSLVRLLTTATIFTRFGVVPLTNEAAWAAYESFAADSRVTMHADEPPGVVERWRRYALRDSASPKLWMDAYLAAFAAAGGWRMVTTDGAFRQFDGLDLVVLGEN